MLLAYPDGAADADAVAAWLARREAAGALRIVADDGGAALGFVQLHDIHRRGGHAMLAIALLPEARGRGVGRAALDALHDLARREFGLRKLMLEVRADNAAAIALYQAMGYRTVGTLRAHYDDGARLHDVCVMERLLP